MTNGLAGHDFLNRSIVVRVPRVPARARVGGARVVLASGMHDEDPGKGKEMTRSGRFPRAAVDLPSSPLC